MSHHQPAPLPLELPWEGKALHRFFIVDVFTEVPLEGNQLGLFADARGFSVELMQRLALELGFAETVFAFPPEAGGDLRIRIFTPAHELPFAGHPVLGSAFVVGEALGLSTVRLETGSGIILVALEGSTERPAFGRMQQPIPTWEPYQREAELLAALGVPSSGLPIEVYRNGPRHVFVELESEQEVAALRPDLARLGELPEIGVSCMAGSGLRWKTRMFAPSYGVAEDAATGSAAGPLALHLARHGRIPFGEEIEIHQGAEIGRPSRLFARARGSAEAIRAVEVGGSAVVVARGELRL